MNNIFWWLLGFDILIALVVLGFFVVGLMDSSVSSFNMGIWMIVLMISNGIPLAGYWLYNHDHQHFAKVLLGVIAVPGLIFLVFMLIMLIAKPKWQ